MKPEQVEKKFGAARWEADEVVSSVGLEAGLAHFEAACQKLGHTEELAVQAYRHRARASYYFRHEKYEQTLRESSTSAELYTQLNHPLEAAKSEVINVHALASLLRHEDALALGERLLVAFDGIPMGQTIVYHNLSFVYWMMGDYNKALSLLKNVIEKFKDDLPVGSIVDIELGIAVMLTSLERLHEALAQLDNLENFASEIDREEFDPFHFIRLGFTRAGALMRLGRFENGLAVLQKIRTEEKVISPTDVGYMAMLEAHLHSLLGDNELAEHHFEVATKTMVDLIESAQNSLLYCRHLRTSAPYSDGTLLKALKIIQDLLKRLDELDNPKHLVSGRIELAEIFLALGRRAEALGAVNDGLALEAKTRQPLQENYLKLIKAETIATINPTEALTLCQPIAMAEDLSPELQVRAQHQIGKCLLELKDYSSAATAFRQTITHIQTWKTYVAGHAHQANFLERAKEPIKGYLTCQVALGTTAEAILTFLEEVQHTALLELQVSRDAIEQSDNLALKELSQRRENFMRQLDLLTTAAFESRNEWTLENKDYQKEKTSKIRSDLFRVEGEIRRQLSTSGLALVDEGSVDTEKLSADTCLVTWFEAREGLYVLVSVDGEVQHFRLSDSMEELEREWEQLFRQLGRKRIAGAIERRSAALWHKLIGAARPLLAKSKRLIVLPIGPLWRIPFAGLHDQKLGQAVAQRWTISQAPSLRLWHMCQQHTPQGEQVLLVGAAGDESANDFLPYVRGEIGELHDHFPQAIVLLDEDASRANLTAHLPHNWLIHFAGHIEFDIKRPMMSGIRLHNNRYYRATDFYLRSGILQGSQVVLSGCESGRVSHNGPEMVGLISSLVAAGASGILASLWPVDDQATAVLMKAFYSHLQDGSTPAEALRKGQLELIRSEEFSHPIYWAAWVSLFS